jgi:hypothetical protein
MHRASLPRQLEIDRYCIYFLRLGHKPLRLHGTALIPICRFRAHVPSCPAAVSSAYFIAATRPKRSQDCVCEHPKRDLAVTHCRDRPTMCSALGKKQRAWEPIV